MVQIDLLFKKAQRIKKHCHEMFRLLSEPESPQLSEELSSSSGDSKYHGISLLSKQFSIYHIKICGANRFIFQKSTKNQKSIIMIVMKFLVSFLNLNLPNRLKSYLLHLVIQNLKRNNFLQWHLLR